MNGLIYDWEGTLKVRKENGLEYSFNNCDKPELGFDYDVLIYEDIEVKIIKWQDEISFEEQDKEPLSDDEKDAVETYIANSEPPMGHTLQQQFVDRLCDYCNQKRDESANNYGFDNFMETVYAGREGSNHPNRSDARRVLEYTDAVYCVFEQVVQEIKMTREDHLKDYESYLTQIPLANPADDSRY